MYYILIIVAFGVSLTPTFVLELKARLLAFLLFDILRLRRSVVMKNLNIAFADEKSQQELAKIARDSYYNFLLNFFEFFASIRMKIDQDISVVGKKNLDSALAKSQGVYILCFHMGNWEAMGAKYSNDLVKAYVLVKKVGKGGVNRFVEKLRQKNNFLWVKRQSKGDGFNAIKEALSKNEAIGFVIDQARPGEPKLPFFGEPAKTNTSFAAIWQKQKAPIVPSFIIRKSFGVHELHCLPEVIPVDTGDIEKDVLENSKMFNVVVEQVIRQCPEQYFWMHNRWK